MLKPFRFLIGSSACYLKVTSMHTWLLCGNKSGSHVELRKEESGVSPSSQNILQGKVVR